MESVGEAIIDAEEPRWAAAPARGHGAGGSRGLYAAYGKRIVDVVLASLMLAGLSPLMGLAALVILITDGPSVVFTQHRAGLNLKSFVIFKFRTMRNDLPAPPAASWKRSDPNWAGNVAPESPDRDPRIIRAGGWLRRYSLDELPQLINVLRGEMSIIGPRPLLCQQVTDNPGLRAEIVRRSVVKPGITGLWQVSGRSDVTFEKMMMLDGEYVAALSFRQDLTILLKTVLVVVRAAGAA